MTTSFPSAPSAPCQHLGVPAYFVPGGWDVVSSASPTVRYVILNPASGPGSDRDGAYAQAVRVAQARDVTILGYVDTDYGDRSTALIEDDIERYRRWYGVDGVFFDRAGSTPGQLEHYARLVQLVRSVAGSVVAMNPGLYPDEGYAALADLMVTFEGDLDAYRQMTVPPWAGKYRPSRFWHLVYSSSEADLPEALELAWSRGAGTVYVTDRGLDNPWDAPASYWALETAAVAASAIRCTTR